MAKTSMIEKNNRRLRMSKQLGAKRAKLKETIMNKETEVEDRFAAMMALAALPRNSAKNRYRNRCELTGRSRGVYRKFGLGRNKLREATMRGDVPGLRKASW